MTTLCAFQPALNNSRQEELLRWWNLSFDSSGDTPFWPISHYASCLPTYEFAGNALDAIRERLHECKARCPKDFRDWCYKEIDKVADKVSPKAASDKIVRKGAKDLQYESHGDRSFIKVEDKNGQQYVWIIPTSWLPQARLLWPVHIRYGKTGPYISRKRPLIQPDGRRVQRDQVIHQLFLGCDDGDRVFNRDGNWLNYCNDNLFVAKGLDPLERPTAILDVVEFKPLKAFDPKRVWRTPSREA